MKGLFIIFATLAVVLVSEAASYNKDQVKTKLYADIERDGLQMANIAQKYWDLGDRETERAQAARYNLAAQTINSISTIRHIPLNRAVLEKITGGDFEENLNAFLRADAEVKTKLDDKLDRLYRLGTESKDGKIFFQDVSTLAKLFEERTTQVVDMKSKGVADFKPIYKKDFAQR